jgi:hypothetical protein
MGGTCNIHGGDEKVIQNLSCKSEGKKPFGTPRLEWEDNIKIDLKVIGCEDVDWIHVVHDIVHWQG